MINRRNVYFWLKLYLFVNLFLSLTLINLNLLNDDMDYLLSVEVIRAGWEGSMCCRPWIGSPSSRPPSRAAISRCNSDKSIVTVALRTKNQVDEW